MGVTAGGIGVILATLIELEEELGFSDTSVGVIVAVGFLGAFVAQVGFAQFADRGFGRQMVTIGIALSAVSTLAMVVADGLPAWVIARFALGFGAGLIFPGLRRAASVLDPKNVGANLGRLVVGEVIGFLFGPVFGAVLVEIGGFRMPFVVLAIGMALFLPIAIRLPADQGQLDTSGRSNSFDLLGNRRLQGALLLVGGYFMLIGAFEAVIPVMFRDRGGSALDVGLAFTFLALPIIVVSTYAGKTADRIGPPKVATAGILTVAVTTMTYGLLPGILLPVIVMSVVGFADGFGFIAAQVAVSRAVEEERQAGALGLMGAVEVGGAGIAAIPAALLYDHLSEELAWFLIGLTTVVMVGIAWTRLRGTAPVNQSGTDLDFTPVDRHPTPK